MDAFYAQVEIRDNPALANVPLILAHDPRKNGGRGVVATANYVARKLGVHSAMSAAEACKAAEAKTEAVEAPVAEEVKAEEPASEDEK
ncbi:hypothetical protein H7R52_17910 [Weissella confusa]|uniref:UmuC domain-containing protein n=1 Tax=Weissella confusa TaxID=1583 RepID=A0A923NHD7_WEICO|nr:hypothetical protein [Weissella confusa]